MRLPAWSPGWPHFIAGVVIALAALGFAIAAFAMAWVALTHG